LNNHFPDRHVSTFTGTGNGLQKTCRRLVHSHHVECHCIGTQWSVYMNFRHILYWTTGISSM